MPVDQYPEICGPGAKLGTPQFVSVTPPSYLGPVPNYHLLPSDTIASSAGDPTRFPTSDIDGQNRPLNGSAPDAGADEH